MAKVNAPLLSFGGSGTVAGVATYSKWKGVPYVRQRVIPANPRTTAQQLTRTTFALLREMWKIAPPLLVAPWNEFAKGRPFTGMNKFVGENLRVLRGELDFTNFIGSPGARGGLPADSVTAVGGVPAGSINVTFVPPAPPTGWVLTQAVAVAFLDQDPSAYFQGVITAGFDASTPYVVPFAGLTPGSDYCVSGWLQWEKPDGSVAYSVSVTDIVTATP